jgi:hypothetical protein
VAEAETHARAREGERAHRLLATWRARLVQQTVAWEGEHEQQMEAYRLKCAALDQSLTAVLEIRRQWDEANQGEFAQLQAERADCEALRREWAAAREAWLERGAKLDQMQRSVAEQALALEQYRQECVSQATNPRAAERRLQRLQQRWATQSAHTARDLARQRQQLEEQAAQLQQQQEALGRRLAAVSTREHALLRRRTDWEQQQLVAEAELRKWRQEVHALQAQRDGAQRQIAELREEIDRLARLLLDDAEQAPAALQAA